MKNKHNLSYLMLWRQQNWRKIISVALAAEIMLQLPGEGIAGDNMTFTIDEYQKYLFQPAWTRFWASTALWGDLKTTTTSGGTFTCSDCSISRSFEAISINKTI